MTSSFADHVLWFQNRVGNWAHDVFGAVAIAPRQRQLRFMEEAAELVQSMGLPKEDVYKLVDYVYSRPAGRPGQEAAGTMVSLAALCWRMGIDLGAEAFTELNRIESPEVRAKLLASEARKVAAGVAEAV